MDDAGKESAKDINARLIATEENILAQAHLIRALVQMLENKSPGFAETLRNKIESSATLPNLKIDEKHQRNRNQMAARALQVLYGI